MLIIGTINKIKIWDINTYTEVGTLDTDNENHNSRCLDIYNNILASSSTDKTIKIYNMGTFEVTHTLEEYDYPNIVCFSPDGRYLASSSTDSILIWDCEDDFNYLYILVGHNELVKSMCFSPDGKEFLSCSSQHYPDDGTILIWDCEDDFEEIKEIKYDETVNSICFKPIPIDQLW